MLKNINFYKGLMKEQVNNLVLLKTSLEQEQISNLIENWFEKELTNIDSTILAAVTNNLVSDKLEVEINNKDIIPNDYITKLYELKSTPENSIEQFNAFVVLINKCKSWNDMVKNLLIPYINNVKEIKTEIKYFVNAVIDNESVMSIKIPFEQFIDQ